MNITYLTTLGPHPPNFPKCCPHSPGISWMSKSPSFLFEGGKEKKISLTPHNNSGMRTKTLANILIGFKTQTYLLELASARKLSSFFASPSSSSFWTLIRKGDFLGNDESWWKPLSVYVRNLPSVMLGGGVSFPESSGLWSRYRLPEPLRPSL